MLKAILVLQGCCPHHQILGTNAGCWLEKIWDFILFSKIIII
jgi:hypothetical protein